MDRLTEGNKWCIKWQYMHWLHYVCSLVHYSCNGWCRNVVPFDIIYDQVWLVRLECFMWDLLIIKNRNQKQLLYSQFWLKTKMYTYNQKSVCPCGNCCVVYSPICLQLRTTDAIYMAAGKDCGNRTNPNIHGPQI